MELRDPTVLNSSKTLDHFHRPHHPLNHPHQLQHQQQQEEIQEQPGGPETNLDSKSPSPSPISHALTICPSPPSVRYRECLKNHAAPVGGHVLDGCGEFMPGGEEGSPVFFKCAACSCHRSFHRKESIGDHFRRPNSTQSAYAQNQHHHKYWRVPTASPQPRTVMMGFGGGAPGGAESSSEDQDLVFQCHGTGDQLLPSSSQKKRFRTKFTKEQKDEMMEFAEKIGWRIQKEDERELQQFCAKVDVKRQVFKVWMHNNKQALKKQQQQHQEQ